MESVTALSKGRTGIPGFDEIAEGGLPHEAATLLLGGPGTGKTVFALQTLVNGARDEDEPGIFVAFEEKTRKIQANALSFGWDVGALERDNKLFFFDARPAAETIWSGEFHLDGMLKMLSAKVAEMGARRIVFDSIDVLLALLGSPQAAGRELRRVSDWLGEAKSGLMGIFTARMQTQGLQELEQEAAAGYPALMFVADCVVLLHSRVDERVTRRELRIVKFRGSSFEQNEFPFAIGPHGIEAGSFGAGALLQKISGERVSTGISRLDVMLGGGYFRGSSVLITGSPGTAKTTLAASFAQAACRRQERVLYIAFDETASEIVRNLTSVNIQLMPFLETGLLHIHPLRSEARSAEEHLIRIKSLLEGYAPHALVFDPLSALMRAGSRQATLSAAERLIFQAKSRGVTVLATSLQDTPFEELSRMRISTIADSWIQLSYVVAGGERNRTLTIVKARGIGHSNQVRELVLSARGITLTDVYTAGGEVLVGTLRAERESELRLQRELSRAEVVRRRQDLEVAEAGTAAQVAALQRELAARRAELEQFEYLQRRRDEIVEAREQTVTAMRQADTGEREVRARSLPEGGREEGNAV